VNFRHAPIGFVLLLLLPIKALADDRTVSSEETSPIATSSAANGSPGDITITSSGSLKIDEDEVDEPVVAVTIDTSNSLTNSGLIRNTTETNAIGVEIVGGNSGLITNSGTIEVGVYEEGIDLTGSFCTKRFDTK
jgi:hypothetical protein